MFDVAKSPFALVSVLVSLGAAACGGGSPAGGGAPKGPPPAPVKIASLASHPVEQVSEYVATLRSRRSTQVRPQVDGIVTRIRASSGDRVRPGAILMEIDAAKQQAAVGSTAAARAAQEASVTFARDQHARSKELYAAGAISKQEYEQAEWAVRNAEATLDALKAREQESRVELRYYRVTAPTAGVVGDIPVRVGDRVTPSTVLTTVDENAALEAYINVPIERAPELRRGLPVRLVDSTGQRITDTTVSFISPQVDDTSQSVLVKAQVPAHLGLRTEQFVRARIVWGVRDAVTIPTAAVARINGQYFTYLAEPKGQGLVARQRAVRLGELHGSEYVVIEGLTAGDRVVVSGIQRLADGAPLAPQS